MKDVRINFVIDFEEVLVNVLSHCEKIQSIRLYSITNRSRRRNGSIC